MRLEKKQLVDEIGRLIENSTFLYMVSYKGLKVKDFNALRDSLAEANATCLVLKNRLIRKAAELKGIDAISNMKLDGETAMVGGSGDPGAVAKAVSEFAKKNKNVTFKGGYLDGRELSINQVSAISELPPKEVLQAQLLGLLEAPKSALVRLLNTKLSSIVYVLNSYKDKK